MNTCDTCRHWQWPFTPDGKKHFCCHDKVAPINRDTGDDGAKIEDIEFGTSTGLLTGPKFGCIHHEQK